MKRALEVVVKEEDEVSEEKRVNKLKNIVENRRFLYSIGEYELEDGEIIG